MEKDSITITKRSLLKAYREAEPSQREFMKRLFGTVFFANNLDVTERVKTFDDALRELGDGNPLVAEYQTLNDCNKLTPDLLAYLRLRVITAALNEGWEPRFTPGECRYYPWLILYTKEEYDRLDDNEKKGCVPRPGGGTGSYCGLVYVKAYFADSVSSSGYAAARLAYRTRELAQYAAKQFADIWADFLFKPQTGNRKEDAD